jgi:hypothetical protein
MFIAVWQKGMQMNYGNMLSYVLSAEQIVIAIVYLSQGQAWKAANFTLGAMMVYVVTRM